MSATDELRRVYPRVIAKALAHTRSLPDAEDAVHDAIERALVHWPASGMPDSVEAWLLTTAINAHRDKQRRQQVLERRRDAIEALAQLSPWVRIALGDPEVQRGWKDELLRLLFACCHPVLQPGESAALALSTVIGLSVSEVAAAFVVAPRSMEQRLTRARQRLRELGDYDGTRPELAHDRLDAVLTTLHLLFNEGYWSSSGEAPLRADLCRLAIGLAHSLLDAFPSEPEAAGLLALLLLHDARRAARLGPSGKAVPLPEQNRMLWDHGTIRRGTDLLEHALSAQRPGPFQTEAAISAVHCRASNAHATEWAEITGLYALLETFRPTPAVRVNRAFATGRAHGPAAGLALLDDPALDVGAYPYADIVRGALLEEAGSFREAHACLLAAAQHTRNADERAQLEARIQRVHARIEGGAAHES